MTFKVPLELELDEDTALQMQIIGWCIAILLIWIVLCSCCCACHSVLYALEKSCCVGKGLFRLLRRLGGLGMRILRAIFCCCRRRRKGDKRKRGIDQCFALKSIKGKEQCTASRSMVHNFANCKVRSQFCEKHWRREKRRHASEVRQFEASGNKYTINLRWRVGEVDVCKEMRKEIKQAKSRASSPGWLYLFTSTEDEKAVPYRGRKSGQTYMYKIGMTTQAQASTRVSQWEDARFENVENVGYWRVPDNALSAEQLVHTLLSNSRYVRLNSQTDANEIEWFGVTYETATDAIRIVLAAKNNYDLLNDAEVCANFQ